MRIAILDDYQNCISSLDAFRLLKDHDVQVLTNHFEDEGALVSVLNYPDALVLNRTRTKITASLLDCLPSLKVISQTGKNAGHIDVEACESNGIVVLEGKGDPTATAELTWLLIMNGLRRVPQAIEQMKLGLWQTNIGKRVKDKLIGIWGYGRIGKKIAAFSEAFDAVPLIWGSQKSREQAADDGYRVAETREEFFSVANVVSLHIRLTGATRQIVKYEDLVKMKKTSLFVNTSRAALIEEGSLYAALRKGRPGFAALDVFDEEPIYDTTHPLLNLPNVICTPHLGYVEHTSYELYFGIAFQNLLDWWNETQL